MHSSRNGLSVPMGLKDAGNEGSRTKAEKVDARFRGYPVGPKQIEDNCARPLLKPWDVTFFSYSRKLRYSVAPGINC